jgi:hypothetical protein
MGLKFTPPKNIARYAYAIEYENSQAKFQTYDDLGSVKNAVQHAIRYDFKAAYILENVDGDWYVLHTYKKGDEHFPWQKEVEIGGWHSRYKVWRAVPMTREEYAEWRVRVERERVENEVKNTFKTFTSTNVAGN